MPGRTGSGSGRTGGGHSMSGGRNGGSPGGGRSMGGSARGDLGAGGGRPSGGRNGGPAGGGMNVSRRNAGGMSQGRTPAAGGPEHGGMGHPGGAPHPAGMRRRPPHPPVLPFGMRHAPGMNGMGYDESYRVLMALEALMHGRFDPGHVHLVERFLADGLRRTNTKICITGCGII